jgi:hypothetical protein
MAFGVIDILNINIQHQELLDRGLLNDEEALTMECYKMIEEGDYNMA